MLLRRSLLPLALSLLAGLPLAAQQSLVYFGTYTVRAGGAAKDPTSKGIYVSRFDTASGKLEPAELAGEITNPSFFAIHPNAKFLYAVGETNGSANSPGGTVTAFSIDASTGKLTKLNEVGSQGGGPCFATVDKTGRWVLVANFGTGSVASIALGADGKLGEVASVIQHKGSGADPQRQKGPHAHSINLDSRNRFAVAADLGTDRLYIYNFDQKTGKLSPHGEFQTKPGAGPRHFSFHPSGKFAFVVNEMGMSVTSMYWDGTAGKLVEIETVPTIPGAIEKGQSTAEVLAHPSGNFVYASNRGHDTIAVFNVDKRGKLARTENQPTQGKTPRNFGLSPDGKWLIAANQDSNNVVVFKIDQATGVLQPTGQKVDVPMPVCVRFLVPPKSGLFGR
ncbi:MAG: lactonase family protein [Acidobacteriota bacterium]